MLVQLRDQHRPMVSSTDEARRMSQGNESSHLDGSEMWRSFGMSCAVKIRGLDKRAQSHACLAM